MKFVWVIYACCLVFLTGCFRHNPPAEVKSLEEERMELLIERIEILEDEYRELYEKYEDLERQTSAHEDRISDLEYY